MALTKCTACGKDVSEQAAACPNCGHPIAGTVMTVELTSKKWKTLKVISGALFVLGMFVIFQSGAATSFGIMLWFFAFVLGLIGKFGAWWTNQ